MSSHLNLIGSIIIGGLVLLMIARFNSSLSETSKQQTLNALTIENSAAIIRLIEFDFNRMGLRVAMNTNPIVQADSTRITFLSDIDLNGVVDTLRYVLSDTSSVGFTVNPRDRILYRLVNHQAQRDAALGVTHFRIRYLDNLGNATTDVTRMRTFEISLRIESIAPYDQRYSSFYWKTQISPPNLDRF